MAFTRHRKQAFEINIENKLKLEQIALDIKFSHTRQEIVSVTKGHLSL